MTAADEKATYARCHEAVQKIQAKANLKTALLEVTLLTLGASAGQKELADEARKTLKTLKADLDVALALLADGLSKAGDRVKDTAPGD